MASDLALILIDLISAHEQKCPNTAIPHLEMDDAVRDEINLYMMMAQEANLKYAEYVLDRVAADQFNLNEFFTRSKRTGVPDTKCAFTHLAEDENFQRMGLRYECYGDRIRPAEATIDSNQHGHVYQIFGLNAWMLFVPFRSIDFIRTGMPKQVYEHPSLFYRDEFSCSDIMNHETKMRVGLAHKEVIRSRIFDFATKERAFYLYGVDYHYEGSYHDGCWVLA